MDAEGRDSEAAAGNVEVAPMAGGPFVSGAGERTAVRREPRQRDTVAEQQDNLK